MKVIIEHTQQIECEKSGKGRLTICCLAPVVNHVNTIDTVGKGSVSLLPIYGFEDPENYPINQPSDSFLGEVLCSPMFIAIAAITQGIVVGGLATYELKKFEKERSEIYIYDLAVSKEYRRIGVATALIEALKPIALERKAWVIYVQADFGDEPAIQLYNKLGVEERVLHFDISLKSDA